MPHREVVYFDANNAREDSQNLLMRDVQAEVRVDAGARLLERRKMKPGRVGNRLHTALPAVSRRNGLLLVRRGVGVIHWNGRLVYDMHGLREGSATQIRVLCTAIPGVPTGVHIEIHKIGEPPDLFGSGRPAVW